MSGIYQLEIGLAVLTEATEQAWMQKTSIFFFNQYVRALFLSACTGTSVVFSAYPADSTHTYWAS